MWAAAAYLAQDAQVVQAQVVQAAATGMELIAMEAVWAVDSLIPIA